MKNDVIFISLNGYLATIISLSDNVKLNDKIWTDFNIKQTQCFTGHQVVKTSSVFLRLCSFSNALFALCKYNSNAWNFEDLYKNKLQMFAIGRLVKTLLPGGCMEHWYFLWTEVFRGGKPTIPNSKPTRHRPYIDSWRYWILLCWNNNGDPFSNNFFRNYKMYCIRWRPALLLIKIQECTWWKVQTITCLSYSCS